MKYQVSFCAKKHDIFTLENNMLSSHEKRSLLSEMDCYFIGVYITNRTLHGRLEIRNFSSSVKKYFASESVPWYHAKELPKWFHLNGHTIGFCRQTYKLEHQSETVVRVRVCSYVVLNSNSRRISISINTRKITCIARGIVRMRTHLCGYAAYAQVACECHYRFN